jgi:hypothetical protein
MPAPLTLDQVKAHLKLSPSATDEDSLLVDIYLPAALGAFNVESKRRWPKEQEPTDADTGAYLDENVLTEDEQGVAKAWLLLTLGHLYENRASVFVGINFTELPLGCASLMNLIRVPTL